MVQQAKKSGGFTVIELMIAVTLMAILLAIAVPSFKDASLGSELRSMANDLIAHAALARSEAIKRNAIVTLCVSADGATCVAGGWEQGWIVTSGGTVIKRELAAPPGFRITGSTAVITFRSIGAGATSATLNFCRETPTVGHQERVVTIDASGRAWVRTTTLETCP